GFTIDGKALTLIGEAGAARPLVLGGVLVQHLALGQDVVLRGLQIDLFSQPGSADVIRLLGCVGTVWIEDSVVDARPDPNLGSPDYGALRAEDSSSVVLVRDRLLGDLTSFSASVPGICCTRTPLVSFVRSTAHLFDCVVTGHAGANSPGCINPICVGTN